MNTNDSLIAYILLCVVSFIQVFGFTVYECVAKATHPVSTVHMTRMTLIVSMSCLGVFLIGVGDALQVSSGPTSSALVAHQIGYALLQGFFMYFLVVVGHPVMGKVGWRNHVYDLALVAGTASFLMIPTLLAWVAYSNPPDFTAIMSVTFVITQAAVLVVVIVYAIVYIRRRFFRPLRIQQGNEEKLATYGILACITAFVGFVSSASQPIGSQALPLEPEVFDTRSGESVVVSLFAWNLTTIAMIMMKTEYARGLMRHIGGKVVYSHGYAAEADDETAVEATKPVMGVGAMA